jgi:hypothetical protein
MADNINKFVEAVRQQISEIEGIGNPLYRRIVYIALYDALSRVGFPQVARNHQRVIQFIDICSSWQDKDRVSSQQLLLELQDRGWATGRLYEFAHARVAQWVPTTVITAKDDPWFDEAVTFSEPDEVSLVKQMCYKELFYTYRNRLVHEFSRPGLGTDLFDDSPEPYYHSMMDVDTMERLPWQLVFPVAFFHHLCQASLAGLEAHLRKNNLNPYLSFEVSSKW